jgi:hypothetical protein
MITGRNCRRVHFRPAALSWVGCGFLAGDAGRIFLPASSSLTIRARDTQSNSTHAIAASLSTWLGALKAERLVPLPHWLRRRGTNPSLDGSAAFIPSQPLFRFGPDAERQ